MNSIIEITKGTTLEKTIVWPENALDGYADITGWTFAIYDPDNVAALSNLSVSIGNAASRILNLDMSGDNVALLGRMARFRIRATLPNGKKQSTNRISINVS